MYPSDLINPKEKGKDYCLQYIKEAFSRLGNGARRKEFILYKQYANAKQPASLYEDFYNPAKDGIKAETYINTNFKNVAILPKFKNIVLNYLSKREYDFYMDAINPIASEQKEDAKLRTWVQMQLQPEFQKIDEAAGIPQDVQDLPQNLEELELGMLFGFRLPYEVTMELGVEMVKNEQDWKEIMNRLREDMFATGYMCCVVEVDAVSKKPRLEWCPIEDIIFEEFVGNDGSRSLRVGRFKYMTIGDLILETGDQFTSDELLDIADRVSNKYGNSSNWNRYNNDYHSLMIEVLDFQWFSIDTFKVMKGVNRGNPFSTQVDFNTPVGKKSWKDGDLTIEREVSAVGVKTVYGGKWITGSDYIYDYGKAKNIPRHAENPRECSLKFKLYKATDVSPVAAVTEFVDAIQLDWIKLRNVLAKAAPNGWDIDLGALEDMVLDGKKITVADTIKMKIETGVGIYRRKALLEDEAYNNNPSPIIYTQGGVGQLALELAQDIDLNINYIRQTMGVNEAMDASTPKASQLVGVQQIALAGSQNAIDHLLNAQSKINEMVSVEIARSIQLIVKYFGSVKGFITTEAGRKLIEIGNEVSSINGENIIYSCRVEPKPTEAQIASINQKIQLALANSQNPEAGGIQVSDAIEIERMLNNGTNLKLVSLVLQNRIDKVKREAMAIAQQRSQTEHENRMAEIEAKRKADIEAEQFKAQIEMQSYQFKTDQDIRKIKVEKGLDAEKDALNSEFRKSEQLQTAE